VREANPGVVYCSITGFGGTGAGRELAGYDFLVQAVGGLMSITGLSDESGGEPTKVGVALVDVLTAKDAISGILAALVGRQTSGTGQRIEVNLLSSLLASLVNQASSYLATGDSPSRLGNAHPSIAPYELLACADGDLAIACGNDGQFRKLAIVLGDETLADDDRFASNAARVANRPALALALERLLAFGPVEHWVAQLSAAGVPAGKVGTVADGFALATELGLDPLVEIGDGLPDQVRNPVIFSDTPITDYAAPPRLGQHSDDIRRWLREEQQP
jgi:formyl-CoA transferase